MADGVRAIMGKMESGGSMIIQALRFDKGKFTMAEARKWVADHPDVKAAGEYSASALSVVYDAEFRPFEEDNQRFVKVFVLDEDTWTRRAATGDWAVTKDAVERNIQSLIGKPLVVSPQMDHGPKVDNSSESARVLSEAARAQWIMKNRVGEFVKAGVNGGAWGVAQFTGSDKQWQDIKDGKLLYLSPEVRVNPLDRVRTDRGDLLHDFDWVHVAFVDRPAFGPHATVKALSEGQPLSKITFAAAMSRSLYEYGQLTTHADLDQPNGTPPPNDFTKDIAAMNAKLEALQAENKLLKDYRAAKEDEDLTVLAASVADLKIKAGVSKSEERDKQIEFLKKLGVPALKPLSIEFAALAKRVEDLQNEVATVKANPRNVAVSYGAAAGKDGPKPSLKFLRIAQFGHLPDEGAK